MPGEGLERVPAEDPGTWGTIPIGDLIDLLQTTTAQLAEMHKEVALDEGAYHRRYWSNWQKLPPDMSVAAMQRDCELVCRELNEEVIIKRSLREGLQAKQHALIAVIAARVD